MLCWYYTVLSGATEICCAYNFDILGLTGGKIFLAESKMVSF
jgi:hypothetical protein